METEYRLVAEGPDPKSSRHSAECLRGIFDQGHPKSLRNFAACLEVARQSPDIDHNKTSDLRSLTQQGFHLAEVGVYSFWLTIHQNRLDPGR